MGHRGVSITDKVETRRTTRECHQFAEGFGYDELAKLIKEHLPKKEPSETGSRGSRGGRSSSSKGSKSRSSGSQRSGDKFQIGDARRKDSLGGPISEHSE